MSKLKSQLIKKIISSVVCGIYISIGATAFLSVGNVTVGALFFTSGICLVNCYCNMLVTRVIPLSALREYKICDMVISLFGNIFGTFIYACLLSLTRVGSKISEQVRLVVEMRIYDTYLSIFILSVFCGFLVGGACLSMRVFKNDKIIGLLLLILFIAVFVVCGFEHVVANAFFFSLYWIDTGLISAMPLILIISFAGNWVGGIVAGLVYKYLL